MTACRNRWSEATRPLLTQHNCTALIEANNVKRVLADIDADYGDCGFERVGHGVLLVFGAPCQLRSLAGQEHDRTIPLADISCWIRRTAFMECLRDEEQC
jgi:hypothetical protein